WYSIGTYIFEEFAFLSAAIFCFRNWRSPQIVSGRNVWFCLCLGMAFYFLGGLLFGYWELVENLDPEISLGDFFYIATYISLGWGMVLAVISRKLNLEVWQWTITVVIAVAGIALAVWLLISAPQDAPANSEEVSPPVVENVKPTPNKSQKVTPKKAPEIPPSANSKTSSVVKTATSEEDKKSDTWVTKVENFLQPLKKPVNLFYIVADVFLLIIATTLLLAFWGGRFALSWRMIAAAAFCFYIGDSWFKYATDHIENYQSGFLLEVFWVFSGVLFAIGAILEYDTSCRATRPVPRKRAK
ncbi:MAG TPA: hypothetical protein V6C58_06010, partial [Allocoleopsis sp.]